MSCDTIRLIDIMRLFEVDQVNIFGSYQIRRLHAVWKYVGFPPENRQFYAQSILLSGVS